MRTMCPGQDTRFWKPSDVFEIECSACGAGVEFMKDDARRRCQSCGRRIENPRLTLGCAQWCSHAKECLGYEPPKQAQAGARTELPVIEKLVSVFKDASGRNGGGLARALKALEFAEELVAGSGADPVAALAAALLLGSHGPGAEMGVEAAGASAAAILETASVRYDAALAVLKVLRGGQGGSREAAIARDADALARMALDPAAGSVHAGAVPATGLSSARARTLAAGIAARNAAGNRGRG